MTSPPAPDLTRLDTAYLAGLIRVGILAAPVGNALKLIGNLGTFNSVGYGIPQADEAVVATGPAYLLGQLVGSIGPVLLFPFALLALFGYLHGYPHRGPERPLLTTGLVCGLLGAGTILPALGVITFAIPALGQAYLAGDPGAMTIADSFLAWPRGAMTYPAVLAPIGAVLLAVVMWRTRAVPRPATALFAFATVLIAVPIPLHSVRLAGGVLGLVAGTWVAIVVRARLA